MRPIPLAPLPPPEEAEEAAEPGLTLRNVTLEQPDENGVLLWRVNGEEVTYSSDRQVALITRPDGELFQDGKLSITLWLIPDKSAKTAM